MVLTQKQKYLVYAVVLIAVLGLAWFMLRPDSDISNDGTGADGVRINLQSAGQHNAEAGEYVGGAAKTAADLERANSELRRSSEELEATSAKLRAANEELERLANEGANRNQRNFELIGRGKQILEGIRERGQSGNQSP